MNVRFILCGILFGAFTCVSARFVPGFNKVGYIHTRETTSALEIRGCALDYDGKIIVVGQTDADERSGITIRYNQDGSIDTTFNTTGYKIENGADGSTNSYIFDDCMVDDQGKIVVVGRNLVGNGVIVRYNNDGSLDADFRGVGYFNGKLSGNSIAFYACCLDKNGKIVVVGGEYTGGSAGVIARYNDDGSLDAGFNGTGYINTQNDTASIVFIDCMVDDNNKIVAVGRANPIKGLIVRYNQNGTLDTIFNAAGVCPGAINIEDDSHIINGELSFCYGCAFDSDCKVIVVGSIGGNGAPNDGFIARYNSNGTIDTSLNNVGYKRETNFDSSVFNKCAIDQNNTVTVVGNTDSSNGLIVKYTKNGSFDTSFNNVGYMTSENGTESWYFNDLVVDQYNRIIAVGITDSIKGLVVRYLSNGLLDAQGNWNLKNCGRYYKSLGKSIPLLND